MRDTVRLVFHSDCAVLQRHSRNRNPSSAILTSASACQRAGGGQGHASGFRFASSQGPWRWCTSSLSFSGRLCEAAVQVLSSFCWAVFLLVIFQCLLTLDLSSLSEICFPNISEWFACLFILLKWKIFLFNFDDVHLKLFMSSFLNGPFSENFA